MSIRKSLSQLDLLKSYFEKHPNRDIPHPEVVDWATKEWSKLHGTVFRDPDRGIRSLYQKQFLLKVKKGVYRYNPEKAKEKLITHFSASQREKIFKRDDYRCVICGLGKTEGVELQADHIKPIDVGGESTLDNGQTLCSQHNFIKKNFKQTETGKKMFIRLYELSKKEKNQELKDFCSDVLKIYERHNMNGQIKWKK